MIKYLLAFIFVFSMQLSSNSQSNETSTKMIERKIDMKTDLKNKDGKTITLTVERSIKWGPVHNVYISFSSKEKSLNSFILDCVPTENNKIIWTMLDSQRKASLKAMSISSKEFNWKLSKSVCELAFPNTKLIH